MEEKRNRSGRIIQQGDMNKKKITRYVPVELMHLIQSLLPVKEAARTSILSKSWLHAWSTHPKLRFPSLHLELEEKTTKLNKFIDATLRRYHHHNIPIQSFCLDFRITYNDCLAEKWIRLVTSNPCLKELSLALWVDDDVNSFTLPNQIFSNKNLKRVYVINDTKPKDPCPLLYLGGVIKCVSLRVLHLHDLRITQEVLDNLLSTCILLEKVYLCCCLDSGKTIKVKNLVHLNDLRIITDNEHIIMEIDHVPSLRVFLFWSLCYNMVLPFNMDSLGSVEKLYIGGVIVDQTVSCKIKSELPLLENLKLGIISYNGMESLVIKSALLKKLTVVLLWFDVPVQVLVDAPKLLKCVFGCEVDPPTFISNNSNQVELKTISYIKSMENYFYRFF